MLEYIFRRIHEGAPLTDKHYQYMIIERKMSDKEIVVVDGSFPEKTWGVAKYAFKHF